MSDANVTQTGEPVPDIQKLLDTLPGMIGGLDAALIDHVGHPVPFVLVLFSGKTACHATNLGGEEGMNALKGFVQSLDTQAASPAGEAP